MSRIRAIFASAVSPGTSPHAAIAPALIIGLNGAPVRGFRLMALNASPVGSRPIFSRTAASPCASSASPYVSAFEIDWIVNASRESPDS